MGKLRKIPQRTCIGCREVREKRELLRIVRDPEGQVEIDLTGKRSGRGAYICPDIECLEKAVKGRRLSAALQTEIPGDLAERLRIALGGGSG